MSNVFNLGFGQTEAELSLESIPVQGRIPAWLHGTLVRNGPGTFSVGNQKYRHWFDGLSMLHKFSFIDGKVSYANRYLEGNSYRSAIDNQAITYSEFATDPSRDLFGRLMTIFSPQISDNAKVSVAKMAKHYMALAETPIQVEFDLETLKSVGVFSFEKSLSGQMTTVHPQFDFERNEIYNLVTRFHAISHYNFYRLPGELKPVRFASQPVREPAYIHSFGMSQKYLILAEFPLVVNPISLLLWLKPYIENFHWKPQHGTNFYVFDRFSGKLVKKFESEPFFAFHHINAFEQGDDLVVDIDAYEDASIIQAYYLNRLEDEGSQIPFGKLRRYHLPMKGRQAEYEILSDSCIELANFDYVRYNTRSDYRYVYASSINPHKRQGFYNQLVKIDLQQRRDTTWYQENCYPGEPVFVGRPGREAEDDGVILSVVLDAAQGNSFLLVLDAASLSEIARAEIPHAILFGYHGSFMN